jgi:hypothetical protein
MKNSLKINVAAFLDNTPFLNSRTAFRAFTAANPTTKVKQTYFYTLFALFGTRATKKERVEATIISRPFKNCMEAYKEYKTSIVFTRAENPEKPVAFVYFLNLWKKHFNISGTVRTKKVKVAKTTKAPAVKKVQVVEISKMTAREILAKVTELIGAKKEVPTNVKDKAKIVKVATKLFTNAGYQVK